MILKESIIILLGKYGNNKSMRELVSLYYDIFPEKIENVRRRYSIDKIDKTEKEIFQNFVNKFWAEIDRRMQDWVIKSEESNKVTYSLTEEGIKYYKNLTDEDIDTSTEVSETDEDVEITEGGKGIVYLLLSEKFNNVYKIGSTSRTVEERLDELKVHPVYGVFYLVPKMYIEVNNFKIIERVLHKFFEDFRMGRYNHSTSTELFKDNPTIEIEFELFIEMLQKNPTYKNSIGELIKL